MVRQGANFVAARRAAASGYWRPMHFMSCDPRAKMSPVVGSTTAQSGACGVQFKGSEPEGMTSVWELRSRAGPFDGEQGFVWDELEGLGSRVRLGLGFGGGRGGRRR